MFGISDVGIHLSLLQDDLGILELEYEHTLDRFRACPNHAHSLACRLFCRQRRLVRRLHKVKRRVDLLEAVLKLDPWGATAKMIDAVYNAQPEFRSRLRETLHYLNPVDYHPPLDMRVSSDLERVLDHLLQIRHSRRSAIQNHSR